jgi:hypothetical protein
MTNEERIAEFMHTETWGYPWDKTPRAMKDAWREKARSLLTFLDSLGFVQKDEYQEMPIIVENGKALMFTLTEKSAIEQAGFVRVKSILAQEGK